MLVATLLQPSTHHLKAPIREHGIVDCSTVEDKRKVVVCSVNRHVNEI
jgi:hypothetical protein